MVKTYLKMYPLKVQGRGVSSPKTPVFSKWKDFSHFSLLSLVCMSAINFFRDLQQGFFLKFCMLSHHYERDGAQVLKKFSLPQNGAFYLNSSAQKACLLGSPICLKDFSKIL